MALFVQLAFAQAGPFLRYVGETADTGSAWYTGPENRGAGYWDYVHELSGTDSWSPQLPYYLSVWWETPPYGGMIPNPWRIETFGGVLDHRAGALQGKVGMMFELMGPPQPTLITFWIPTSSGPPGPDWTPATGWGQSGDDITFVPAEAAVPEPASMALSGLCLLGVAAWKRSKAR
ncbi:MAG TPA: hypothetical protein DEP45_02435 [Armatimonadetes bacterium]|nr:hypothetical protein [Armatimonadota bacterium]